MIRISDLGPYLCRLNTPLREAMARINVSEHLFQLVVDSQGRLLGTLTDGDIRRALLRGMTMETTVRDCMHVDFVAGHFDCDQRNLSVVEQQLITFLPMLDEQGRIVEVFTHAAGSTGIGHALVMAGGFGRRLGERTRSIPKPLLTVGDRPILDHVLSALEDAGIRRIHVSIHYLADQVRAFVLQRANRAEIHFIEEDKPMGTAGALRQLSGQLSCPVLVVNGDILTRIDLAALHEFHLRHHLDGTIGVTQHSLEVPFGVVRYDENGLFQSIEEKPRISNFIAAGIYYLGPEFSALVPSGRPLDMPELLNRGRDIGLRIGLFPIHEYWTDLGRPDDLAAAERKHEREATIAVSPVRGKAK